MKMQAPDEKREWNRGILARQEQVELWQQEDSMRLAVDAMSPMRVKRDGSAPVNSSDLADRH